MAKSPIRQQPNKVLAATCFAKTDLDSWPFPDFSGDPWWAHGTSPRPYKWSIKLNVTAQQHSDPTTRASYQYNANDIYVGDWVADLDKGRAVKIVSIVSKTTTVAEVVVEDVDRYNTFQQVNGIGIFPSPSNVVVFDTNDANMPVLNPMPANFTDASFSQEVMARFVNNNPLFRSRVHQVNHGLQDNDSIWVDPADSLFKTVVNTEQLKRTVGTVDQAGPGPDIFYFVPSTKVVEGINPALPGNAGDLIYVDPLTGKLSTTETDYAKVAYLQLTNASPDITNSTGSTVINGNILSINETDVPFTGSTLQSVANDVNATTTLHGVAAAVNISSAEASTVSSNLARGSYVACMGTVASASINGVTVLFNNVTSGTIEFGSAIANAVDMANSINAANIPNIHASGIGSSRLSISNSAGGAITLVNISNDSGGIPFAGAASCSGVPLSTAASTSYYLEFTNASGSGIIFKNKVGTPVTELGLTSVRNGALPLGLVVEQYVTTTSTGIPVYATLAELPATGTVGSQAYVIDSDNNGNNVGEWSMYLWDGFNWVNTSNEDSATTNARTLKTAITFDSPATTDIGILSDGRKVMLVMVEVTTAFNGTPTLDIGIGNNTSLLMSDNIIDLTSVGSYSTTSNFVYSGTDAQVTATYAANDATVGSANITVTYV